MANILMTLAGAALAAGLGGCVGSAGISTWEYQSGPDYETERIHENRIEADPRQGLTHDACTSIARRQVRASGEIYRGELTTCRSR